MFKEEQRYWT